jgi:NADH dehydrogenase FAD-containing subunit
LKCFDVNIWNAGPIQFPFRNGDKAVQSYIEKQRANIASAKSVVIVGGGAVGIEMAGEIRHFYPVGCVVRKVD